MIRLYGREDKDHELRSLLDFILSDVEFPIRTNQQQKKRKKRREKRKNARCQKVEFYEIGKGGVSSAIFLNFRSTVILVSENVFFFQASIIPCRLYLMVFRATNLSLLHFFFK